MLKRIACWSAVVLVMIVVLFFAGMLLMAVSGKARKVSEAEQNACIHSDYQTIMSKVIRARTKDNSDWMAFSDAQNAAERAHIFIDTNGIKLSGDIWMVPLTQNSDETGARKYIALLDCSTDNVEFSGG